MDEEHARVKSKKHKEMLVRMSGRKAVSLADDEDEVDDEDGEGAQLEDMKKPQPKTASDVEDSDEDEKKEKRYVQGQWTRGAIPKMTVRRSARTSRRRLLLPISSFSCSSTVFHSSQHSVVQLDSDDSEDDNKQDDKGGGDSEEDEEPLFLTQRLVQTSTKWRIILNSEEIGRDLESMLKCTLLFQYGTTAMLTKALLP
ncbi:MAG: hypothetical protein J3Q66DRAFT_174167 [Benniella sp.]|nr:MAG: hypothetical protein J3Q66DRAFT_174167 [Benniella sp.]